MHSNKRILLEKTRCRNLRNSHYTLFTQKHWHERLLCHQVHRQYETSHYSFHRPPQKWLQHSRLGVLWHWTAHRGCHCHCMLSLSELESNKYSLQTVRTSTSFLHTLWWLTRIHTFRWSKWKRPTCFAVVTMNSLNINLFSPSSVAREMSRRVGATGATNC